MKKTPLAFIPLCVLTCFATVFAGTGDFHYRRGLALFEGRQYSFAFEDMQRALAEDPAMYQAHNMIVRILIMRKEYIKARNHCEQSLAINDAQPDTHYRCGELSELFYDSTKARRHFSRAVALDPGHKLAHLALVRYLIADGDRNGADAHHAKSIDLGRAEGDPLVREAAALESDGKRRQAIGRYIEAEQANPGDTGIYFKLSYLYQQEKDYRKAVRALQRLVKIRPDTERAYCQLAYLYYTKTLSKNRRQMLDLAAKSAEKALELNPRSHDTLIMLSEIYQALGQDIKAGECQRKAGELDDFR